MPEILSQQEIDSLNAQHGALRSKPSQSPVHKVMGGEVKLYDFAGPGRFSKEQLRTLEVVHASFARLITSALTAYFNAPAQLDLIAVDQATYDEYLKAVHMPPVACVFRIEPLAWSAVLEIEPPLALAMIDRLTGGRGEPPHSVDEDRDLTAIEQGIVQRVMTRILDAYAESWSSLIEAKPEIQGLANASTFGQIALPADMSLICLFEFRLGVTKGLMSICFPMAGLEAVLTKLSMGAKQTTALNRQSAAMSNRLRRSAEGAELGVNVVLGRANVTLGELLQLDVGDVVQLDTSAKGGLEVRVEGVPKFLARPGTVGRRMAVQVTKVLRSPSQAPEQQTEEQAAA